jgi:hypothetical protein
MENENTPLVYTSPFERIINLTNNIIADAASTDGSYGFWANSSSDYNWQEGTSESSYASNLAQNYLQVSNLAIRGYSALGLRAQFATHLLDYNTVDGNYGVLVKLVFDSTY